MNQSTVNHAIITGGSSGIGLAIAKQLASSGYHLSILARDKKKLDQAVLEITQHQKNPSQKFLVYQVDVSDEKGINQVIKKAVEDLGTPKLLITSAGIARADYFENLDSDVFREMIEVNYLGTLYPIKAILPYMKTAGEGQIVLVSSAAALTGVFGYTAYGASKFAVRGLAESLRSELVSFNIQVSIAYPPDTDTPQLQEENKTKPKETKLIANTNKIFTADEVSKAIIKGINKKKFMITPGVGVTLLSKFHSLFLPFIQRYFDYKLAKNRLINWGETYSFLPEQRFQIKTEDELKNIVEASKKNNKKIRIIGSFYSYTPLVATKDILISLEHYTGIVSIDKKNNEVIIKTGTKLEDLEKLLFKEGLALNNMGDINKQTLGGFISTGCHGTGKDLQGFSSNILKLKLLTANAEWIECSATKNPELFKAGQVALGSLGIITEVTLKVRPAYNISIKKIKTSLDICLSNLDENFRNNSCYEFFWFPYTDDVLEKKMNLIDKDVSKYQTSRLFNDYVIENGFLWLICELSRNMPKFYRKYAHRYIPYFLKNSEEEVSCCGCYATPRLVKHFEIEYAIPYESAKETIIELKKILENHSTHVSFPVEVRCSKSDDIYLSPSYKRDSVWISVHAYVKDSYIDLFKECEKLFVSKGGRPHWGKLHWQTEKELKNKYEKWHDFHKIRDQLDPQRLFSNEYLRRIFGDSK